MNIIKLIKKFFMEETKPVDVSIDEAVPTAPIETVEVPVEEAKEVENGSVPADYFDTLV